MEQERRISVRTPIRCRIDGQAGSKSFMAEGFDVSDTGLSFTASVELPQNSRVILHYRLDEDGPMITATVQICQQTGGRYGAKFLDHHHATATAD